MFTHLEKKLQLVIATFALLFGLLISGFLKGAMDQEGVPMAMRGFVSVAFIFLQLFMFLSWLSYLLKWKNILFLSLPSTIAILAIIVLYEGVWREEGLQAERRATHRNEHEQLAKTSSQSWACKEGWKLNEKLEGGLASYYLSQPSKSDLPVLIAKTLKGGRIQTTGQASALPLEQLKDILKSCKGDGYEALRKAYFPLAQPKQ